MMIFDLVKELVHWASIFNEEQAEGKKDLDTFLNWLGSKRQTDPDDEKYSITGHSLEVEIAAHIGRMGRYSNTYIKMALEGLPFSTDMEFTFTAILDGANEVGKTDLIRMMAYDKSSGMGVIRRLLKKGLIEEFPNPEDKRGKLLRLTKQGKRAVELGYLRAPRAANLVSKNLNESEKQTFLRLLKKLDDFHYPIYLNEVQQVHLNIPGK